MGAYRAVSSLFVFSLIAGSLVALLSDAAVAEEPNDTFAEATILGPGVLTVSDDLYPGDAIFPDTLLGAFDSFGNLVAVNDDDSLFGDGLASGFFDVNVGINNDISFTVTGFGDDFFDGSHDEFGEFEAVVEVYNFNGGLEDAFSVFGTLEPGFVNEFNYSDSNWLAGSYNVNIDNTIGSVTGGDVDFFTFTDLTPGAMFSAETLSPGSIDTMLGWYDSSGNQVDFNDDFNEFNFLSQIQGNVPSNGQLTFAVTGYGDDFFEGTHIEQEAYDLQVTVDGASLPGDFDGDFDVDIDDLEHPTLGWQARYGSDLHGADFLAWQKQVGSSAGNAAAVVPEPSCSLFFLTGFLALSPALACCRKRD